MQQSISIMMRTKSIHSIYPFSYVVTAGQLTGQLNFFMVRLHTIIKGPSLKLIIKKPIYSLL